MREGRLGCGCCPDGARSCVMCVHLIKAAKATMPGGWFCARAAYDQIGVCQDLRQGFQGFID
jgi:hypothetical protein